MKNFSILQLRRTRTQVLLIGLFFMAFTIPPVSPFTVVIQSLFFAKQEGEPGFFMRQYQIKIITRKTKMNG